MIYVGGVPFPAEDSSSSPNSTQGSVVLVALMDHPILVSASHSFRAMQERKFSFSEESSLQQPRHSKCVFVFQREYATVDPSLVDLVGTDEATTCVGIVIRNRGSGMVSVAHLDSPNIVDIGLTQMLALVADHNSDAILDVHLVGAFEDTSPQQENRDAESKSHRKLEGYSFPLCSRIIEILGKSREIFHIQTLHVLGHNTRWDSEGNALPIFHGVLVETSTGSVIPASFDRTSRCPDEIVRRIRRGASFEDPSWTGRLLETYDTQNDRFVIAPCLWTRQQLRMALTTRQFSDTEILLRCSSSPFAEGPDFVDNERRQCEYLIQHPDCRETFPLKQPRVFERTADGGWTKC
ncbi:hypothetical protein LguiA_010628 [Lonicera macranthoides]